MLAVALCLVVLLVPLSQDLADADVDEYCYYRITNYEEDGAVKVEVTQGEDGTGETIPIAQSSTEDSYTSSDGSDGGPWWFWLPIILIIIFLVLISAWRGYEDRKKDRGRGRPRKTVSPGRV